MKNLQRYRLDEHYGGRMLEADDGDYVIYDDAEQEIAKLHEELEQRKRNEETLANAYKVTDKALVKMEQRAEAAEARIKEAEGQEPVAFLNLFAWKYSGYRSVFATPERAMDNQVALYTCPIPLADAAELQAKLDATIDALAESADKESRLERKLAEQQALLRRINEESKLYPEHEGAYAYKFGAEELHALLAKAEKASDEYWIAYCAKAVANQRKYDEAEIAKERAEAVPEDVLRDAERYRFLRLNGLSDEAVDAFNDYAPDSVIAKRVDKFVDAAMLAAAQKPANT